MVVILLIIYGFLHLFRLISMDNANIHAYTLWIEGNFRGYNMQIGHAF
jgi:hypothetical protein